MNTLTANINPTTGVRYGVISGNTLDQDVLCALHDKAYEINIASARAEVITEFANSKDFDYPKDTTADDLYDLLMDEFGDEFDAAIQQFDDFGECPEVSAEFVYDGVSVVFSWLGGAPIIFVTESPYKINADLCSPCVPNAGNLDSKNIDGYECYDVPESWYPEKDEE